MIFRRATFKDYQDIAALHALSWQRAYRDVLSSEYLEKEVVKERKKIWAERLDKNNTNEKQWVLLLEDDEKLLGFICIIAEEDSQYGSLIDNLHVHPDFKRKGLGKQLLQRGIDWAKSNYPASSVYLWVYTVNTNAILFYEKMEGKNVGTKVLNNPDGGAAPACRILWE